MALLPKETKNKLVALLGRGDTDSLKKFLVEEKIGYSQYADVLDQCIRENDKECALMMLKGEFPSADESFRFRIHTTPILLLFAISLLDDPFEVVQLMLSGDSSHALANKHFTSLNLLSDNDPRAPLLPIHITLNSTMFLEPLQKWSPEDSLVKLIILLFDPRLRRKLQCAGLVAEYTTSINEVASGFIYHADLKELAALLLVAHQLVLPHLKGLVSEDSKSLLSKAIHGKHHLAALALVHIFIEAADSLSELFDSLLEDASPKDYIVQVASVIQKAGFQLTPKDLDLSEFYTFEPEVVDYLQKALDTGSDDVIEKSKQPAFPSVNSFIFPTRAPGQSYHIPFEKFRHYRQAVYGPSRLERFKAHLDSLGARTYSVASQAHFIHPIEKSICRSSLRSVAFLAMQLKRGIRFL